MVKLLKGVRGFKGVKVKRLIGQDIAKLMIC